MQSATALLHCRVGGLPSGSETGRATPTLLSSTARRTPKTEAQIAVRTAGLVLIPVQPSPLDLWATEATPKMVRDERRRALIVLNRVMPAPP
jgi:chromosome partitioning protein